MFQKPLIAVPALRDDCISLVEGGIAQSAKNCDSIKYAGASLTMDRLHMIDSLYI